MLIKECNNLEFPTKLQTNTIDIPPLSPASGENSLSFDSYSADVVDSTLFFNNVIYDSISEYGDRMIFHLEKNEQRHFHHLDSPTSQERFIRYNRKQIINWLTYICYEYEFLDESLFTAIYIFDNFISATKQEENSYIAAVCSLWISFKLNETMIPTLEQMVSICNNSFSSSQIQEFEILILNTLHFDIVYPTPTHISDSLLSQVPVDETFEKYVSLFCHCALFSEDLIGLTPSHISFASIILAKIATSTKIGLNVITRSLSFIHEVTLIHCLKSISYQLKRIFQCTPNAIKIKFEQYIMLDANEIENIIKKSNEMSSEKFEIFLDNI